MQFLDVEVDLAVDFLEAARDVIIQELPNLFDGFNRREEHENTGEVLAAFVPAFDMLYELEATSKTTFKCAAVFSTRLISRSG